MEFFEIKFEDNFVAYLKSEKQGCMPEGTLPVVKDSKNSVAKRRVKK